MKKYGKWVVVAFLAFVVVWAVSCSDLRKPEYDPVTDGWFVDGEERPLHREHPMDSADAIVKE